ncbi:hypothetical protein A2U01_0083584, partial [Trifolium medium]|nr:hypothetical protein [Trifolium medium]
PEETTWENWNELNRTYNLEDKVGLEGEGIDTNLEGTNSNEKALQVNPQEKPKRNVTKPNKWNDFIPL